MAVAVALPARGQWLTHSFFTLIGDRSVGRSYRCLFVSTTRPRLSYRLCLPAASRRPTLLTRAITLLDKSVRGVRPRDLGLAGSARPHLICAARHSISHRLYSPLQSRGHRFCGVCGLACCRACGDFSIVVAVSGINRHSRSPTSPESKLSGPAECS
jgi:hypothetical protein